MIKDLCPYQVLKPKLKTYASPPSKDRFWDATAIAIATIATIDARHRVTAGMIAALPWSMSRTNFLERRCEESTGAGREGQEPAASAKADRLGDNIISSSKKS